MSVVSNAQHYDWQTWIVGVLRSFVAGASGAVTGILGPMATDSHDFNFGTGIKHTLVSMTIGFCIGGIAHMMIFLQTHSVPELVTVKSIETTVTEIGPGETKVSAVETIKTVPKEATKP